jgi:hypothetical protein
MSFYQLKLMLQACMCFNNLSTQVDTPTCLCVSTNLATSACKTYVHTQYKISSQQYNDTMVQQQVKPHLMVAQLYISSR